MANFFIERPVFAWVLAIIMMFTGGIAIMNLPVAQYPQIAPQPLPSALPTQGLTQRPLKTPSPR